MIPPRGSRRGRAPALLPSLLLALLALAALANCKREPEATTGPPPRGTLLVWHAYRGDEQAALMQLVARARTELGIAIETLAMPFDAYASKLESAIPHGHGPDLFIDAHERLASYLARGLVAPIDRELPSAQAQSEFGAMAANALSRDGRAYAFPLAIKCLALFVNTRLLPTPPATLEDIEALRGTLPRGTYPLVYEAQSAYFHAALAHAYGSGLVDDRTGRYLFVGDAAARSVEHAVRLVRSGVVPEEASGSLVSTLFSNGRAATAISGPWLAADLGSRIQQLGITVVPLPVVRAAGQRMQPLATVEGAFVSARARERENAVRFARFLVSTEAAVVRARVGQQVVLTQSAWERDELRNAPVLQAFREAAQLARVTPTHPNMRSAFEPAGQALRKALRGDMPVREALEQGEHRFRDVTRPPPSRRDPTLALIVLGALAMGLCVQGIRRAREPGFRRDLRRSLPAYAYVTHAVLVLLLLVVLPLVIGASTSLFAGREGALYYVGLANYWDILRARGGPLLGSGSFYLVLCVTVLWTIANITLHVAFGVALALLLSRPTLRFKGGYRVLLIIPWAVPSYVTALAWKGMFHRQLGAINAIITSLGGEPVAWFARFSTAFAANVATNVWLGFPFMMVVTLGALAQIPKDVYEAAAVDGATPWQRFRHVTLPLLRPSLAPAVAMGAVWTFNMFNVIFLVSGGEPDGQTEILVTEAYRWAFTRQAQYGYAAAYAVLIFGILVLGTRLLDRLAARAALPSSTNAKREGHG